MSIITAPWEGYGIVQGYGPAAPGNPYNEPIQFGSVPFHDGIDFAVPTGTPVPAPFAATVLQAGDSGDGYGIKVAIQASNGYVAFYGHLGGVSVSVGQTVSTGQQLGTSDNTGNSTGPHLHVGAHTPNGGTLNPDSFPTPNDATTAASGSGQSSGSGLSDAFSGILGALQAHPRVVAYAVAGLVLWELV